MPKIEVHRRRTPFPVHIIPLAGLPEFAPGDDLARLLFRAVQQHGLLIKQGDVFVVAQKVVSKTEGRFIRLDSVRPSDRAKQWAAEYQKDARVIEVVLMETKRIVRMDRGVIIAETHHGFVCANAGVDISNVPEETVTLLPENPDRSARMLQEQLAREFGVHVAVVISDTFGRPWREGLVNVALGVAGMTPLADYRGELDAHGKTLSATVIALADELAAAAGLVMGKLDRVPVAVLQGMTIREGTGSGHDLIRPEERDLFR